MNSDIEGSGLGFMPQSSTTVAAPAGEEDQTYNSRVDKPLIETKTIIQGSNRLALPREEPAVDTSTGTVLFIQEKCTNILSLQSSCVQVYIPAVMRTELFLLVLNTSL
jgi:hypothetical protein